MTTDPNARPTDADLADAEWAQFALWAHRNPQTAPEAPTLRLMGALKAALGRLRDAGAERERMAEDSALEADARRWRFLRDTAAAQAVPSSLPAHDDEVVAAILVRAYATNFEVGAFRGEQAELFATRLDANVDAAMRAAPGTEGEESKND